MIIDGVELPVIIEKKRIKNIYFRVNENLEIYVTCPKYVSKLEINHLLKSNEKLKIPTGKRRSCVTGAGLKLNLNNDNNNILKTLTPPKKKKFIRTDKNGVEINKDNKKKVHITFLDEISPDHKITEVINIQSFKQYNVIEEIPGEDILPKISKCCSIF